MFDDVDDEVELIDLRGKDEFTEDKKSKEMKRLAHFLTLGQVFESRLKKFPSNIYDF